MLNGKVYVVTSLELVNAVNRNSKILAFNPFIAQIGKRITGHDEATSQIVQHNLNGENGPGYVTDIHDETVASLAPGPNLESMTRVMLLQATIFFRTLQPGDTIDLFAWIRHTVTMCSTRAIYGPNNPFNHDEKGLVKAFWYFMTPKLYRKEQSVLISMLGTLTRTSTRSLSMLRPEFLRPRAIKLAQSLVLLFSGILRGTS